MTALTLTIARGAAQARDAARLRHMVFVQEMGVSRQSEWDALDDEAEHLTVSDPANPDLGAVAALRLNHGGAYTAQEFDLAALTGSGLALAEMGRMCLHPAYRGGVAGLTLLLAALDHLLHKGVRLVVGTGSFPGANAADHMPALRALRDAALAPEAMRPRAWGARAVAIEGSAQASDMRGVPALIKAYVRAGAWVGEGAWVDPAFNTVDVCMVLDMARVRVPAASQRLAVL